MSTSKLVVPFNTENFVSLLAEYSKSKKVIVEDNIHTLYFIGVSKKYRGYLCEIGANTIVIENDYISKDYMEDFSEYYVRTFKPYGSHCCRLHFFKTKFTEEEFDLLLLGKSLKIVSKDSNDSQKDKTISVDTLKKEYLGHIVIKPLPKTIIGTTCLARYKNDEGRRFYPVHRPYKVNLYGLDLQIDTIAFQEQDKIAAACATSALWSTFQKTSKLFNHPLPSPIKITKSAIKSSMNIEGRRIPNSGLNTYEMINAINNLDLEVINMKIKDIYQLKGPAYAYSKQFGLPQIMNLELHRKGAYNDTFIGNHAVTITGYSIPNNQSLVRDSENIALRAYKIEKLYVHDDGVGPFACMEFALPPKLKSKKIKNISYVLTTSWGGSRRTIGKNIALPFKTLTPIYHKIRIPYTKIYSILKDFISLIKFFNDLGEGKAEIYEDLQKIEWDIYLSKNNHFKEELIKSDVLSNNQKLKELKKPLPKYIWNLIGKIGKKTEFEFVFDATDIEQGFFLIYSYFNNKEFYDNFKHVLENGKYAYEFLIRDSRVIIEEILTNSNDNVLPFPSN